MVVITKDGIKKELKMLSEDDWERMKFKFEKDVLNQGIKEHKLIVARYGETFEVREWRDGEICSISVFEGNLEGTVEHLNKYVDGHHSHSVKNLRMVY